MNTVIRFAAAFAAAFASQAAMAAHPLVTDDTSTQDAGNSQVELNTDRRRDNGIETRSAAFTFSHGVLPNLDMYANLPWQLSAPRGVYDASLGLKWRFAEDEHKGLGIKTELLLPTGDEDRSLGTGRESLAVTLMASSRLAPWVFHANAGVNGYRYRLASARASSQRIVWRASAAAGYQLLPNLLAIVDAGIARNAGKGAANHPAFALASLIYSPVKDLDLDVGLRYGLNSAEAQRQIGVGLTFRF